MVDHLAGIKKVTDGNEYYWSLGEEAAAVVWRKYDRFFLFEVPQYGGSYRYVRDFREDNLQELVDLVRMWT